MTTTKNETPAAKDDEPEPTEAESKMTEIIARDRPTIDAAVKSYISMALARTMAASGTDTTHDKVMMGIIPALAESSISRNKKSDGTGDNEAIPGSSTCENTNKSTSIQQQVLEMARCILKAVNSYTFPIHDTVAYSMAEKPGTSVEKKKELLEISVVARLWNALVQSEQKPSRFLGKRALKLAWKNLNVAPLLPHVEKKEDESVDNNDAPTTEKSDDIIDDPNQIHTNNQRKPQQYQAINVRERQLEWLQRFEDLLFESAKALPSDMKIDDDSALLWAPDGGAAELAKRRQRRLDAAKTRGPSTPS